MDLYRIDANPGDEITAELNFESSTGNLDLYIENSLGNTLVASESSNNNREMTTLCVSSAEPVFQFFVRVAGYRDAENAYALNVASRAGSCCVNGTTEGEPNNSIPTAHPLSVSLDFEGVACSRDSDYFRFAVATASQIEVVLLVTGGTLGASLFSQDGRALAIGRPDGPETIVIRHTTTAIGTYTVRVTGPTTGQARYLGMVTLTPRARTDCSRTSDCPDLGHVCAEASCRTVACTGANTGCPDGHLCTSGLCSLRCSDDGDCRPDERCKWGENGRACARDGNGADGTACSRAGDCSNASACILPLATAGPDAAIPAPIAGYCGRIRCATDSDCGAFPYQTCVGPAGGVGSCALDCGTNPDACAPALTCQDANSLERNRAERVCLP